MNLIIILIILVLIYLVFSCKKVEKFDTSFEDLSEHSNFYEAKRCCQIKKIVLPGNSFGYDFSVKENCRNDYNNNFRYIYENEIVDDKPFTMDKCTNENKEIGSCRKIGFECMDFMTPNDCKKFKMKWSDKTCHRTLPVDIVYPDYTLMSDQKTITR